jgi:hypothetical protein
VHAKDISSCAFRPGRPSPNVLCSLLLCSCVLALLFVQGAGLGVPEQGLRGGSVCYCVRKSSGIEVLGALDVCVRVRACVCVCVWVWVWEWGWARAGELHGIPVRRASFEPLLAV